MHRRRFVQMMTLASAGTLAAVEVAARAGETTTVSYKVRGFTCVTCAVGLETMLGQQKGVKRVKATYSDGLVIVKYDPSIITEPALRGFISDLGFTAEPEHRG